MSAQATILARRSALVSLYHSHAKYAKGFSRTICKDNVIIKVWMGLTLGKMAKMVSPTSPRDVEDTPVRLTAISEPDLFTS